MNWHPKDFITTVLVTQAVLLGGHRAGAQEIILRGGTIQFQGGQFQGPITITSWGPGDSLNPQPVLQEPETQDIIRFKNGDRIRGSLTAIELTPYGVQWSHPAVAQPIAFALNAVRSIRQNSRPAPPPAPHNASLQLTNADEIKGMLLALDKEGALLDTGHSGKITLRRPMLREIRIESSQSHVLYDGPNGLDGWSMPADSDAGPAWQYQDGTLIARSSLPLSLTLPSLPEMTRFDFSAAWRRYAGFSFSFFTDATTGYIGNGYMLQVGGNTCSLLRYNQTTGTQNLGQATIESFARRGNGSAQFSLLVDRSKNQIVLLVDGIVKQQWTDPAGFAGGGNGILFQPRNEGDLRLSDIRVSPWDGRLPIPESAPLDTAKDHLQLVNGDGVAGTVIAISGNQITFQADAAALEIPLDRVERITFAETRAQRARRNKTDARLHLQDRQVLTLALEAVKDGRLSGTSENFGTIAMPLAALTSIDFNIYENQPTDPIDPESQVEIEDL